MSNSCHVEISCLEAHIELFKEIGFDDFSRRAGDSLLYTGDDMDADYDYETKLEELAKKGIDFVAISDAGDDYEGSFYISFHGKYFTHQIINIDPVVTVQKNGKIDPKALARARAIIKLRNKFYKAYGNKEDRDVNNDH